MKLSELVLVNNLNGYSPETSVSNSAVTYGAYRVVKLRIKQVRYYDADNNLISTDGNPPQFTAIVSAVVPTRGFALRTESVLWNHDFARVTVVLERPATDSLVSEYQQLTLAIDVGTRVDQVEVVIRSEIRIGTQDPVGVR